MTLPMLSQRRFLPSECDCIFSTWKCRLFAYAGQATIGWMPAARDRRSGMPAGVSIAGELCSLDHPAGHHATDGHEPRQVRKEAAISDADCVVVGHRSGWSRLFFRFVRQVFYHPSRHFRL